MGDHMEFKEKYVGYLLRVPRITKTNLVQKTKYDKLLWLIYSIGSFLQDFLWNGRRCLYITKKKIKKPCKILWSSWRVKHTLKMFVPSSSQSLMICMWSEHYNMHGYFWNQLFTSQSGVVYDENTTWTWVFAFNLWCMLILWLLGMKCQFWDLCNQSGH